MQQYACHLVVQMAASVPRFLKTPTSSWVRFET